jgi:hypothetical protein
MKHLLLLAFLFTIQSIQAQSVKAEQMKQLSYLVGEWVGTSRLYEDGQVTSEIPAFENITYDLNKSILVIELNSERLKLHTIVHYHEADSTYYYYAFSERGGGKLPARFEDGHMVVQANENKRYIFERYNDTGFREYGEKRINGEWTMYFEDIFVNTK